MNKNDNMTEELHDVNKAEMEKNLFVNLDMPIDMIESLMLGETSDQEKAVELCRDLMQHQLDLFENEEQKKEKIMKRIAEWTNLFGRPDESLLLAMHVRWNMPMNKMMEGRLSPASIKRLLDHYIVGQEQYKEQLAVAFSMHIARSESGSGLIMPPSSLLVHGPTGNGKTHALRVLGQLFELPIIVIHCNNIVPVGYVGTTIPDAFTDVYMQKKSEIAMLRSIILFDEFDKIVKSNRSSSFSDSCDAILNEILSLTDSHGEVVFDNAYGREKKRAIHLPTDNMMFVYTGVFDGLEQVVAHRLCCGNTQHPIGFTVGDSCQANATCSGNDLRRMACDSDFVELGLKPEIMGRIGNVVNVDELTVLQLADILDKAHPSLDEQYQNFFARFGINLCITDDAKMRIAQLAAERHLGARGVAKVLAKVLAGIMPSLEMPKNNERYELIVNEEYVNEEIVNN